MKKLPSSPLAGYSVTFPEPWVVIRRPVVRLALYNPVMVVTGTSHYCVPVYTLSSDRQLTDYVKSYAHYSHVIKGVSSPDVSVSYLTLPRFVLALRSDISFRALVLSSPISITEG